ncbi:MAG: hypothetical protein AVDCRST_MAG08-659, partial [uncultured Acetobacteraceae bacterium]
EGRARRPRRAVPAARRARRRPAHGAAPAVRGRRVRRRRLSPRLPRRRAEPLPRPRAALPDLPRRNPAERRPRRARPVLPGRGPGVQSQLQRRPPRPLARQPRAGRDAGPRLPGRGRPRAALGALARRRQAARLAGTAGARRVLVGPQPGGLPRLHRGAGSGLRTRRLAPPGGAHPRRDRPGLRHRALHGLFLPGGGSLLPPWPARLRRGRRLPRRAAATLPPPAGDGPHLGGGRRPGGELQRRHQRGQPAVPPRVERRGLRRRVHRALPLGGDRGLGVRAVRL